MAEDTFADYGLVEHHVSKPSVTVFQPPLVRADEPRDVAREQALLAQNPPTGHRPWTAHDAEDWLAQFYREVRDGGGVRRAATSSSSDLFARQATVAAADVDLFRTVAYFQAAMLERMRVGLVGTTHTRGSLFTATQEARVWLGHVACRDASGRGSPPVSLPVFLGAAYDSLVPVRPMVADFTAGVNPADLGTFLRSQDGEMKRRLLRALEAYAAVRPGDYPAPADEPVVLYDLDC